jgi:hypothetical protein
VGSGGAGGAGVGGAASARGGSGAGAGRGPMDIGGGGGGLGAGAGVATGGGGGGGDFAAGCCRRSPAQAASDITSRTMASVLTLRSVAARIIGLALGEPLGNAPA